jgi:hypothetical protein
MYMKTGLADTSQMALEDRAVILACVDRVMNDVGLISTVVAQHNQMQNVDQSLFGRIIHYVVLNFIGPKLADVMDYAFGTKDAPPDMQLTQEIMQNAQVQLARLAQARDDFDRTYLHTAPSQRPALGPSLTKPLVRQMVGDFWTLEHNTEFQSLPQPGEVGSDEGDISQDEMEDYVGAAVSEGIDDDGTEGEGDENEGEEDVDINAENVIECDCGICQGVEQYRDYVVTSDVHPLLALFCVHCRMFGATKI